MNSSLCNMLNVPQSGSSSASYNGIQTQMTPNSQNAHNPVSTQMNIESSSSLIPSTQLMAPSMQSMCASMPQQQMQQQAAKDYNMTYLCRIGQENVQEIVSKTTELFQCLKVMSPPNGTPQSLSAQEEKKAKVRELMKTIEIRFKQLRKLYERCSECCSGMEYIQIESLIPMKDDANDAKYNLQEEKKLSSPAAKHLDREHQELVQLLTLKNRQIKEIIDHLRSIVWEINTMLAMRKP